MTRQATLSRTAAQDRVVAYHEASHACAALALDVEVDRVTIEPSAEDGSGGHMAYRRGSIDPWSFGPRRLIICLAGQHGQRRVAPKSNIRFKCAADFEEARKVSRACSSSPIAAAALYRWGDDEAQRLVSNEWIKVEAVAAALIERNTLMGDELRAVVAPIVESQAAALATIMKIVDENPGTRDALLEQQDTRWRRMKPVRRSDVAAATLRVMTDVLALGCDIDLEKIRFSVLYQLVAAGFDEDIAREKLDALIDSRAPFAGWKPVTEGAGSVAAAQETK